MAATYFVRIDGKEHGPLSADGLRKMAATRRLSRDDRVSRDGKKWVSAAKVEGLSFPPVEPTLSAELEPPAASPLFKLPSPIRSTVFVQIAGTQYGPISTDRLRELAETGRLSRDDSVSRDGKKWVSAAKLHGLNFAPLPQQSAPNYLLSGSTSKPHPIVWVVSLLAVAWIIVSVGIFFVVAALSPLDSNERPATPRTPTATPRQHARQPDTPAPTTPERFAPGYRWRVSKDSDETVSTAEGLRRLRKVDNSPEVDRQVDEMMQGIPNWRSMTPMERVEAQIRRDGKLD